MALTVSSSKRAPIQGSTVVVVVVTAAADAASTTVAVSEDLIPAGTAWELSAVRAHRSDGAATAWQPQVALGDLLLYQATSANPSTAPDIGDHPRAPFVRSTGEALAFSFGWGSGSDNDATAELVFTPVLGA
jgi:hypothetical protein